MSKIIAEALPLDPHAPLDDADDDRRKDPSRPPSLGRRASGRQRVLLSALIVDLDREAVVACRLENVSDGGARLKLAERRFLPPSFWLVVVRPGLAYDAKLVWREDDRLGVEIGEAVDLNDPTTSFERRLQKIWMARR
jgi:hypothetical protein